MARDRKRPNARQRERMAVARTIDERYPIAPAVMSQRKDRRKQVTTRDVRVISGEAHADMCVYSSRKVPRGYYGPTLALGPAVKVRAR